jgi:hypothetical protein
MSDKAKNAELELFPLFPGKRILYICLKLYFIYCILHYLKVLSNGAGGGPKLVSIDPF